MCGIIGFTRIDDDTAKLLPFLAWAMEDRGGQAWGMSNGVEIHKDLGPISGDWERVCAIATEWWGQPLMVHTRAASVGDVKQANAHPWAFEKGTGKVVEPSAAAIIGCHNGTLTNWWELNRIHDRHFAVDSQHCFANIAANLPTREIQGTGVLLWFEDGEMRCLRFFSTALAVFKLKNGTTVMCSEEDSIRRACWMTGVEYSCYYKLEPHTEYILRQNSGAHTGREMKFGEGDWRQRGWTTGGSTSTTSSSAGRFSRSTDTCWMCNCNLPYRPLPNLLCETCFRVVQESLAADTDPSKVIHPKRVRVVEAEEQADPPPKAKDRKEGKK